MLIAPNRTEVYPSCTTGSKGLEDDRVPYRGSSPFAGSRSGSAEAVPFRWHHVQLALELFELGRRRVSGCVGRR